MLLWITVYVYNDKAGYGHILNGCVHGWQFLIIMDESDSRVNQLDKI